jgi:hypothetical protein
MGKSDGGTISIGADTPTGQPPSAPKGPYTTDEHDDEITAAGADPGQDPTRTKPGGSRTETKIARESALASDNAGDDASRKPEPPQRSTRASQPDLPDELAKRPKGPAQP